ncbi:tyrosine-type recombinase/integrase [Terasakiella sp. A23]|uniref:tyrosine-type recombinase/integrase n=1 Tax=Terasakiella sp. FCG-A23 TaxID=3080561 RepID=UPI0029529F6C|nr:tyrosine-type recombinase/integrase [Terasakiella sp. A23]MDV7341634.1 tyrosine-type recombinase/integrase [Terasakiella sp. A23]
MKEIDLSTLTGAYSENTLRAYKADFTAYMDWCDLKGYSCLPSNAETVTLYIEDNTHTFSPATIRRKISSIGRIHRLKGHNDPTKKEIVFLALRRLHRQKGRRQNQAHPLTAEIRDKIINSIKPNLKGLRDCILLTLSYDTLRRRSEVVCLRIEDIQRVQQGGATILIRRSKTDQEGSGKFAYISPRTLCFIDEWLKRTKLTEGPILRRIHRHNTMGKPMSSDSIPRIIKALAKQANLPQEIVNGLSGHSPRVGAAQDMAAAGIDIGSIMQAGGWKSPEIVARYIENLDVLRSGSFRLAQIQQNLVQYD